eukprot:TRINITY_DN15214_c0_g1_i1.p1 TRINITY_DN15214_c0_g1~~TRINITY_DN15214_c0_g1_i1.p1  ORF type:complete len:213 (+),score=34.63 TRINITY_DN15214_c0_g1_i1:87-725(+)
METNNVDIVSSVISFLSSSSQDDTSDGWVFIKEKRGVLISYKPQAGCVHTLRGITQIKVTPERIIQYCSGLDNWNTSLDPCFKEGKLVERIDPNNDVTISLYTTGVPLVADREFLIHESRGKFGENYYIASYSVERDDHPAPYYPNAVRGKLLRGGFWVEPMTTPDSTPLSRVTWVSAVDPQGDIPLVITNSVCGDEPLVLANLREILEKQS